MIEPILRNKSIGHVDIKTGCGKQSAWLFSKETLPDLPPGCRGGVTKYVDKKGPGEGMYVDFQTALGKGPHRRLLKKPSCCGTGEKTCLIYYFFFNGQKAGERMRCSDMHSIQISDALKMEWSLSTMRIHILASL